MAASPFILEDLLHEVSVSPQAIGAASGLYGFVQMGYGMLCTVAGRDVGAWRYLSGSDCDACLGAGGAGCAFGRHRCSTARSGMSERLVDHLCVIVATASMPKVKLTPL